jgi:hypothetical protein
MEHSDWVWDEVTKPVDPDKPVENPLEIVDIPLEIVENPLEIVENPH